MIQEETINQIVTDKGITEVLHFTTNSGLLGILATGLVKSRALLEQDKYLEFIFQANANTRKDPAWLDHVNLSISRVNPTFFEISQGWHRWEEIWWCVLSLDPAILAHPNVTFVTTNNIYTRARHGKGTDGLKALFAPSVERYIGRAPAVRTALHLPSWPTCEQAEVLYPSEVSTDYLRRVYFARPHELQTARAQVATLNHREIELALEPEMFAR